MNDFSMRERDPATGRFKPVDEFVRGVAQYLEVVPASRFHVSYDDPLEARREAVRRAEIDVIALAEAAVDSSWWRSAIEAKKWVESMLLSVEALRAARRS